MPRRVGRPGLIGTMARTAVVAGTATAVSGSVANKQQQKYAAQQNAQEQQYAQPVAAPPAAPAAAPVASAAPAGGISDDALDRLQKLSALHSAGALTDEEFAAAKAKILGL